MGLLGTIVLGFVVFIYAFATMIAFCKMMQNFSDLPRNAMLGIVFPGAFIIYLAFLVMLLVGDGIIFLFEKVFGYNE